MMPGFSTVAAACGMPQRHPQLMQRAPPWQWRLDPFEVPRPAVPRGQHVSSDLLLAVQMACAVQSSVRLQSSHSNFCQGTAGPCTASLGFLRGGSVFGCPECRRVHVAPAVLGARAERAEEPHLQCEPIPLLTRASFWELRRGCTRGAGSAQPGCGVGMAVPLLPSLPTLNYSPSSTAAWGALAAPSELECTWRHCVSCVLPALPYPILNSPHLPNLLYFPPRHCSFFPSTRPSCCASGSPLLQQDAAKDVSPTAAH